MLAIGIVVDNAIVVVEAVHAKMEEEHLSPLKATKKAIEIAEYKNIQTIFLGDYIDRGPDSVTTIDEIIKISEDGNYCGA